MSFDLRAAAAADIEGLLELWLTVSMSGTIGATRRPTRGRSRYDLHH
jgi:hypothetical protein